MVICEHTISEYTLNDRALYNVTIVYKISKGGKELLAQLTVELNPQRVRVDSIGTEWTDSAAGADRIKKLKACAIQSAKLYQLEKQMEQDNFRRQFPDFDVPKDCTGRHTDYRK